MWRARVPPPVPSRSLYRSFSGTSSSSSGKIAARPRSMTDWPPILRTRTSGSIATASYSRPATAPPVIGEAPSELASVRREMPSPTGLLLDDDGADVLAGQGGGELAGHQAVDDLDALDVARVLPGVEEGAVEDGLRGEVAQEVVERDDAEL